MFVKTQHDLSISSLTRELQIKMKGLANTAALLIDGDIVQSVTDDTDLQRPEVQKTILLLDEIKKRNERIEYVWIMRPSKIMPGFAEFILENDQLYPINKLDSNGNGLLVALSLNSLILFWIVGLWRTNKRNPV